MYKKVTIFFILAALVACATVPITGRKQLSLVPESSMNSMAAQQYSEFITSHELSKDQAATLMVKNVGHKIQGAVERFFEEKNQSNRLRDYRWEFNLVKDSVANAWCMPGGKVVVYTGILPLTKNETGLAVVMGHEIAHAVAQHGEERMSQGLIAEMGGMALSAALEKKPQQTQQLFLAAYGLGATVGVLLPYSRLQESEADHIGLIFMAMAGYNPNEALNFWQRMAENSQGAPPEFLSTHPSDQTRIESIRSLIPEAMQYYGK